MKYEKCRVLISLGIIQFLDQPEVAFCTKLTADENAITNAVDVYDSPR